MKTTSIPLFKLRISFLWLFLLVTCHATFAQTCIAPNTNFSTSATDALCLGSGTVTVSGVAGGSGSYEYQLVHSTNSGLNKPWQTSSSFTSVSSGIYQVQVRSVCTSGTTIYSSVVSQQVTVGGNYETLDLSVNTTPTCGTDGTITTTATKGYLAPGNGYRYALVPSLTEPEPIGTYIRPQQSSNVFSGLAPSTYYVRVYDDCSSYASYRTIQAIVTAVSSTPPTLYVYRYVTGCNSELFYISSTATSGTLSIVYPNNTEEVLALTNNQVPVTVAKFGTGTPPANFTIKYTDACGVVTTYPYVYDVLSFMIRSSITGSTSCNTTDYGVYIQPYSTNWPDILAYTFTGYTYTYSVDNGPTQTFTVTSTHITGLGPIVTLPNDGNPHTVTIVACGQTYTTTITPPAPAGLQLSIQEINHISCIGKTGLYIVSNDNLPLTVHFTSVPAGQTALPDQTTSTVIYDNLIPGTYSFTVSNGCVTETRTFVLEHPYSQTLEVLQSPKCDPGQSGIDVNVSGVFYKGEGRIGNAEVNFQVEILNASNTLITSQSINLNPAVANSFSQHFALSPGTYKVRVKKIANSACTTQEETIVVLSNQPITLNQILATSFCPTQGFTVVQASGGVGPYQYTLYENSIAVNNKLAGPQPGNAFTGLDPNKTYFVAATDACGAGINIQTQFSTVPLTTSLNADSKDCLGQPAKLEVYSLPGATYQWYKNNSPIPGANSASYQIASLTTNDLGVYKVFVTVGTCDDFTTDLTLTGTNCSVLPVKLSSFTVKKEGSSALINWATASEENCDHFEIQHSANGRIWQIAGNTPSKGIVSATTQYAFSHTSLLNGINYYRLKMIDKDGSSAISTIRSITFEGAAELTIYPNPTSDKVTIRSSGSEQISSVSVYDPNGRQLPLSASVSKEGLLDLRQLSEGFYIFKIGFATGAFVTHKVTIIR